MRYGALLAMTTATAACSVSPAGLRSQAPPFHISSQRTAGEIGQCISSAWESRSGSVSSSPGANGLTLTLRSSAPATAAVVDVEDSGNTRSITVHANNGALDQKLRGEIEVCASDPVPAA